MTGNPHILIVGGAGYIGSHVNKELSSRGYDTVVFDNLIYGHKEHVKWGNFVFGCLSDLDRIRLLFKEYPINAVIHCAAFAYVGESVEDPQKYYINNVQNTLNLLRAMLENNVRHFVFSSSCATYGNPVEIPIKESHRQDPVNPYGESKLMIERILRDYSNAYGFRYISLRYFNAAGADPDCEIGEWHDPETHLIPLVLDAANGNRENVKIFGTDYETADGTCIRDYIHVKDLSDAHVLSIEYLLNNGKSEVFNLGNGNGFSVRQVIKTAEDVTKKRINAVEWSRRPGDPPVLVGSSERIKEALKWEPEYYDLTTIIETAWKWHKKLYRG